MVGSMVHSFNAMFQNPNILDAVFLLKVGEYCHEMRFNEFETSREANSELHTSDF